MDNLLGVPKKEEKLSLEEQAEILAAEFAVYEANWNKMENIIDEELIKNNKASDFTIKATNEAYIKYRDAQDNLKEVNNIIALKRGYMVSDTHIDLV